MMNSMWNFIKTNLMKNPNSIIEEYDCIKQYTYMELLNEIEYLKQEVPGSVLKGAKCAVLCRNSIESVRALLFCWRTEMIAIPLSMNYGEEHCNGIINSTQPDFIITDDLQLCDKYRKVKCFTLDMMHLLDEFNINRDEELKNVELMMCTSGTTGCPKAIMFSAEAIKNNVLSISKYFTMEKKDTILISRPIYHSAVLVGELLVSILTGANIVLYSGKYNPMLVANIITRREINVMCGTPTIFKGLASCLKHRNTKSNLRMIALSGEYLLQEYAYDIRTAFPYAKIFNVYGLTEAGPRVSYLPSEMFDKIPQSVGIPIAGVEVRIVSQSGNDDSNIGHVWIKTPSIMRGYYKDAENTKKKFENGWFNTGDIGTFDEKHNLYILGRSDDMIIKAGMNIYPQEIEKKIIQILEIKEVLVYGKIENGIERIIAAVILNDCYKEITELDIMKKVSQILPDYMMPAKVIIVEQLQKNASGKVLRPSKKARGLNDIV